MPIVVIERAIFQLPLPTLINVLYALFFPCAIAGGLVAWPHIADNFWAGVVFDHVLAFLVVQAAVMPFLAANFQKPAGSISARAARMTSSFGLLVCIVALTAQLLGRTILVCVVVGFLLVQIQLSSWGESLVLPLQTEGALGCLIPAYLQDLLNSTPLELIIQFRGSGAPRLLRRFLYAVRTVAPLVLLPDEETDDAIALLRPKLAGRLDTPVVEQLPSAARAVLEPWAQSESLRLRSGVLPMVRRGLGLPDDVTIGSEEEDKADSAMASEGCEAAAGVGAADVASGLAGDAAAPTLAALGEWRGEETDDPDAGEGDEDYVPFTPPPAGAPPPSGTPGTSSTRRRPPSPSQTSSSTRTPGRVREAVGPELLLARLAVRGLSQLAYEQAVDVRDVVTWWAYSLCTRALAVALYVPRLALSVAGRAVGTAAPVAKSAADVAAARWPRTSKRAASTARGVAERAARLAKRVSGEGSAAERAANDLVNLIGCDGSGESSREGRAAGGVPNSPVASEPELSGLEPDETAALVGSPLVATPASSADAPSRSPEVVEAPPPPQDPTEGGGVAEADGLRRRVAAPTRA